MLKNKLKFKTYKKFEENIINQSKFAFIVYNSSKIKKNRWSSFQKTFYSNNFLNNIKVSSFYSKDLYKEQKDAIMNLSKKSTTTVVKALIDTRFSRSPKESFFLIKKGLISVNNKQVNNPSFVLKPGDIVTLRKDSIQQIWVSCFFFTKFKSVTTIFSIPSRYEISFAGSFFVVCFLYI